MTRYIRYFREEVKVGDEITVARRYLDYYEFRKVAKVLKNGIVDDKGTRWTQDGVEFGGGSRGTSKYHKDQAWLTDPVDRERNEEVKREKELAEKRNLIRGFDFRYISREQADAILAILFPPPPLQEGLAPAEFRAEEEGRAKETADSYLANEGIPDPAVDQDFFRHSGEMP